MSHAHSPRSTSRRGDALFALTRRYVVVYVLGTFGDWIQGAYLYAAYRRHGLSKRTISGVYVLGYGVSATLGTALASVGDRRGHRVMVMAYGTMYAASCALMRSNAMWAVLTSRILGGMSYSVLFSNFESWVITEADEKGIERRRLARLFSVATFFNAASAVAAGLVANAVVELTDTRRLSWIGMDDTRSKLEQEVDFGESTLASSRNVYSPAFDVGVVSLLLCAAGAKHLWPKYDSSASNPSLSPSISSKETEGSSIQRAVQVILASHDLLRLGFANSLYEAALHLFVFVWTPILEQRSGEGVQVPHGMIFSGFMVCKMFGSQVFHILESRLLPERLLRIVLACSAVAFCSAVVFTHYWFTLGVFCVFEFGLGIYWPVMAVLRAKYVPNKMRATMTSAFRIPLNILVIGLLLIASRASDTVLLMTCGMIMVSSYISFGTQEAHIAAPAVDDIVPPADQHII